MAYIPTNYRTKDKEEAYKRRYSNGAQPPKLPLWHRTVSGYALCCNHQSGRGPYQGGKQVVKLSSNHI
jgi:hypothetical protein